MIKVIGIVAYGINVLELLKKVNLQAEKNNYEFIPINSFIEFKDIKINESDIVFTISDFSETKSAELTKAISEKMINDGFKLKNIVRLTISKDSDNGKVIKDLEELLSINQNVEIYPTDDNLSVDTIIIDRVLRKNQVIWRNFILEEHNEKTNYKALMTFWSKDYQLTLLEPKYKVLDISHMPLMAPSRFAFKDESRKISGIQDIREIAERILDNYIESIQNN